MRRNSLILSLGMLVAVGCGGGSSPAGGATGGTGGTGGTDVEAGGTGGTATGGTGGTATGGTGGGADAGPIDPCANVDAIRATCGALPSHFAQSTTLPKGCYHADATPTLAAGVTLTISPGTTLIFADGAGLTVEADQALVAVGTQDEPICMTGDTAQRGAWDGVRLGRTEGSDDQLDYVTIEYAGSTTVDPENAALKLSSDSRPVRLSLTNTTVRESQGHGLYLVASADLTSFSNNSFTANTKGPANVDSDVAGLLDTTSSYTGNDVDEITVRTNNVSKNATWHSLGVPYHLMGNLDAVVPWTIEAPNTLIAAEGTRISVGGDAAALHAVGTATDPIVFTGETKQRGFWNGLVFDGTNNASNELTYVTVEYAGNTAHDAANAGVKAIADSHGVTLTISHTTMQENQGYGLFLTGSATLPGFANNTFTKNTLGPVNVGSLAVHQLDTASSYTGNDLDRVRVRDSYVNETVTWLDLGVPYQLESNIHVGKVWTLAPGVTLMMAQSCWISVASDDAGFHAVGTAQKPITITGVEPTSGYWHGIIFDGTLNAANALEYATVENGGSTTGGGEQGMITAQSDSHGVALSVKSSTIRGSAQYGIWLGMWASYNDDIDSANTFADNAGGNVFRQQ